MCASQGHITSAHRGTAPSLTQSRRVPTTTVTYLRIVQALLVQYSYLPVSWVSPSHHPQYRTSQYSTSQYCTAWYPYPRSPHSKQPNHAILYSTGQPIFPPPAAKLNPIQSMSHKLLFTFKLSYQAKKRRQKERNPLPVLDLAPRHAHHPRSFTHLAESAPSSSSYLPSFVDPYSTLTVCPEYFLFPPSRTLA